MKLYIPSSLKEEMFIELLITIYMFYTGDTYIFFLAYDSVQ